MKRLLPTLLLLILVHSTYQVFAQYSRFQEPVWHPSENVIALSNGVSVRLYNNTLSQIVDEYELTTVRNPFIRTTALEWSPNGTMLGVTIQGDDVVPALQIWNIQTGQKIAHIDNIDTSATFSWGMNSDKVAVVHVKGLGDVAIRIYNVPDVNVFTEFKIDDQLRNLDNIRWSPDGQHIAVRTGDELYLLDLQSGQFRTSAVSLFGSDETPRFLFSPDSQYLIGVTSPSAAEITILNVATGQVANTLIGHTDLIWNVDWVDQYIVTTDLDGVTKIWSPTTFQEIASFQTGRTGLPSFSPDAGAFVADSFDLQTVVVRNSNSGAIIAQLNSFHFPSIPSLSPQIAYVTSAQNSVFSDAAYNPTRDIIVITKNDKLMFYDSNFGLLNFSSVLVDGQIATSVDNLSWSPNGRFLYVTGYGTSQSANGSVWDLQNITNPILIKTYTFAIKPALWYSDNHRIAGLYGDQNDPQVIFRTFDIFNGLSQDIILTYPGYYNPWTYPSIVDTEVVSS